MSNHFGEWLKNRREGSQISQEVLAERVGISKQYVSNLERGQPHPTTGARPKPAIDVVVKLCHELTVPIEEFVSTWLLDEPGDSRLRQLARTSDDYSVPTRIRTFFARTTTPQQVAFVEAAVELASSLKSTPALRLVTTEPIDSPEPRRELQAAATGESERGSQEDRTHAANESAIEQLDEYLDSKRPKRPKSE